MTFCIYSENIFLFISSKMPMHVNNCRIHQNWGFVFLKSMVILCIRLYLGQLQQKDSNCLLLLFNFKQIGSRTNYFPVTFREYTRYLSAMTVLTIRDHPDLNRSYVYHFFKSNRLCHIAY